MKKLFTLFVIVMSLSVMLVACGAPAAKPAVKKPAVAAKAPAVADKSPYEAVAKEVAASAGIAEYEWEAYEEGPEVTWDDTLAYYNEQLTAAGWAGTGAVSDIENGKVGVFADAEGNKFVLIYVNGGEKAVTMALFGK